MNANVSLWNYRNQAVLLAIVLLGLFLRLNGLEWGLPNVFHPSYSYHPDEIYLLTWADWLREGHIIPKQFIYGGTFYYLTLQFTNWVGLLLSEQIGGQLLFNTILFGRLCGVIYALVTLYLIYGTGTILFSRSVGLLAAFILAVLPGHVFWAQRVRPDELFALQFVVNLFFMARILKHQGNLKINLCLGGILLGIATATRFPAAILILGYIVAMLFCLSSYFRENRAAATRKFFQYLGVISGVAVLGYLVASPHTIIYFSDFLAGMRVQWNYQSGGLSFIHGFGKGPSWFQYAGRILRQAMGEPFQGLLFIALLFAIWKRTKEHLLLLAIVVPYFLLLTKTSLVLTRYTIPLLPLFSLLIAYFLVEMAGRSKITKALVVTSIIASSSWSLAANLAYANTLKTTDPRDAAAIWMAENVEGGARIGAFVNYKGDLFSNPPMTRQHRWSGFNMKRDNIDLFLESSFDYIVVNEIPLLRRSLLGDDQIETSFRILRDWNRRHPGYSLVRRFGNEALFAGFDFSYLFNSQDYLLSRPQLLLYKKSGASTPPESDGLIRQ
ncbi:glycosyltransferase family 39 protein [Thermodesulfobacteriota bacterium]